MTCNYANTISCCDDNNSISSTFHQQTAWLISSPKQPRCQFIQLSDKHMGVNNFPKVVIQQHSDQNSNYQVASPMPQAKATHTHTFNGPLPGTTRVSRYQKGKTHLEFTEARGGE